MKGWLNMDCIKIIESLIEKASKDEDLKKRLLEDSDKAIYQEIGKLLAVEVKFLQDENGKLTYKIVSKSIPDEDLGDVSGGKNICHESKYPEHLNKKRQELIKDSSLGEEIDEDDLSRLAGGQIKKFEEVKEKIEKFLLEKYPGGNPHIPVVMYAAPPSMPAVINSEELSNRIDKLDPND